MRGPRVDASLGLTGAVRSASWLADPAGGRAPLSSGPGRWHAGPLPRGVWHHGAAAAVVAGALLSGLLAVPASAALQREATEVAALPVVQGEVPFRVSFPVVVAGDAGPELRADILAVADATFRHLGGDRVVYVDVFADAADAARGTARRLGGTVSHWQEHWGRNAASTAEGWIGILAPEMPEDRTLRTVMIAHEFVHTIQQALTTRGAVRPPMWFIEGGAQWLGLEVARTMDLDPEALDQIEQSWRMTGTARGLRLGESAEDRAAYDLGAMAAKSLALGAGDPSLLRAFRLLSGDRTWPSAFRVTFGIRLDDFLDDFHRSIAPAG